jgi:DNA-binding FrmR family transcriptional regulator
MRYRKGCSVAQLRRDKQKLLNRVRRIRGQVEAIEKALEGGYECAEILQTIAATRGAINGLMAEVVEGHIRNSVLDPDQDPASERSIAATELMDVVRTYLK